MRLDEYVEACNLEAVVQEVGGTEAETGAETLFNGQLVIVGMWRIQSNMIHQKIGD